MKRVLVALVAALVVALTSVAVASGPHPAMLLSTRPAMAEVPVDHLAYLAGPVDAYATPGGAVVAHLDVGPVIRTGEITRTEDGVWDEIVTRQGLVWVEDRALSQPVSVNPVIR